ncbi:MAG: tRNA preQ1(34) S-adenosylmethionine ribosyltransferase-isomerase QueA [Candidatus Omnitrophica bacterium]|nr:tRNA preQ1(34) S-adenosylmethionine ribosyltransferase-isomerase QueA [Candidatus Omnitrophota bacterium]
MVKSLIRYSLPEELIAQSPVPDRSSSRLMVMARRAGTLQHRRFRDLIEFLRPGDCLVFNDTRVIRARLHGKRPTGGAVELLLLRPGEGKNTYWCLTRPAGQIQPQGKIVFGENLSGVVAEIGEGPERLIQFEARGNVREQLEKLGEIPLPPYIHRPPTASDQHQYQTVYARHDGAVAAPTAGLHFTQELLKELQQAGVALTYVTLHVGPGTFRPPTEKELEGGRLHAEWFNLPEETADIVNQTKAKGGRVIAVGTTSCRVLETYARIAQGDSLEHRLPRPATSAALRPRPRSSSLALGNHARSAFAFARGNPPEQCEQLVSASGWTDLFIQPGFRFRVIDGLITNFHLPQTSLLSLAAAFAGEERILNAYQTAVEMRYRFYSYGDAMLIQ